MKEKSILDINISVFQNYLATEPKEVNLLMWLNSKKYKLDVLKIRDIEEEKTKKILKSKLPAITPSGLFSKRNAKSLIKHSGFIQFDVDFKDNIHINNYSVLKKEISKIKEIAYDLFNMDKNIKDRSLLINIADKMRMIDQDIWAKYIVKQIGDNPCCIIDDLRFQNELDILEKDANDNQVQ